MIDWQVPVVVGATVGLVWWVLHRLGDKHDPPNG